MLPLMLDYTNMNTYLSSWWYPQTADDRVIILLPPSSCDGWGISKILKHCPVVDMYLPSSRWYRNCSSRSNNIDSNPQTTSPASPSSLFLKSSLTTFLRAKVKYFLKITHICCCYVCICYYGGKTFQSDKNMLLYSETRVCSVLYCIDELALFTFFCLLACTHCLKNIKWTELYSSGVLKLAMI